MWVSYYCEECGEYWQENYPFGTYPGRKVCAECGGDAYAEIDLADLRDDAISVDEYSIE